MLKEININSMNSDTIGVQIKCAPAVLETPRGADDHQERMTAMASIAVPLHSRKFPNLVAYVDEQDYDLVSQFRWNVQSGRNTLYAITSMRLRGMEKPVQIKMHRMILDPPSHLVIDHIDGDGLNNTRGNLRQATHSENLDADNVKNPLKSAGQYLGVYFVKSRNKWTAHYKGKYLGIFPSEVEAATSYDQARFADTGDIRRLNFPGKAILNVEDVEDVEMGVFNK